MTELVMAKRIPEIAERLLVLVRGQPFVPFDVKTTDGDTFHVVHTDFAILSDSGETAEMHEKDGHVRYINIRMVVSVETTRPKKGLLGQGGKR